MVLSYDNAGVTGFADCRRSIATGYGDRVIGRIPILDVEPVVECGRRPAKAVAGETFQVSATVISEGHGVLGAAVVLRDPAGKNGPLVTDARARPGIGPVRRRT